MSLTLISEEQVHHVQRALALSRHVEPEFVLRQIADIVGYYLSPRPLLDARFELALAEIDRLKKLLVEHHAEGALDGVLIGDQCPVCRIRDAQPSEIHDLDR